MHASQPIVENGHNLCICSFLVIQNLNTQNPLSDRALAAELSRKTPITNPLSSTLDHMAAQIQDHLIDRFRNEANNSHALL